MAAVRTGEHLLLIGLCLLFTLPLLYLATQADSPILVGLVLFTGALIYGTPHIINELEQRRRNP